MDKITYEQVDDLPADTMRDILGDAALGKNEAQMRAKIKGALRAAEEAAPEVPEQAPVAEVVADTPVIVIDEQSGNHDDTPTDSITLTRQDFDDLKADIAEIRRENIELKAGLTSRRSMTKQAKQELKHARCRVSEFFRDALAEQRLWLNEGKTETVIVPRSFLVESQHFANGRFIPCAKNGGMYYVRNKN